MSQFKNEFVADFVKMMDDNKDEFTKRKKGQNWKSILFALCDAFPEDRSKVFERFTPRSRTAKIPSGGAKITRYSGQPIQTVVPCDDCPGGKIEIQPQGASVRVIRTGGEETTLPEAPEIVVENNNITSKAAQPEEESLSFDSVEEVLAYFNSDPDDMRAYAKHNNIPVGRSTKPETLANRILNHQ